MRYTFCLTVIVAVSWWGGPCFAQRGGFSSDRFFRYLDQDGDGTIRGSEWDRVPPPMRSSLEEMEIDLERGVQLSEFEDLSRQMRDRMREQGGFGFRGRGDDSRDGERSRGDFRRGGDDDDRRGDFGRGGRSRFGRSSSEDDSGDEDDGRRSYWRSRRGDEREEDRRDDDRGSRESRRSWRHERGESGQERRRSDAGDANEKKRERVTLDLPSEYASRDANRDNQVALYEWPQTDFEAFARLDLNGDGFLTPRELRNTGRPANNTPVVSVRSTPPPSPRTPATPVNRSTPAASGGSSGGSKYQEAAEFAFRALDRDKDGSVGADEWQKSRSTRPLFEKAGIDISQTMSREDFIAHYVRLRSD